MQQRLLTLIQAVTETTHFDDAAHALLSQLLDLLAASPSGDLDRSDGLQARRGMIHLRPDAGDYRGLVVVEADGSTAGEVSIVPSATIWRWVTSHGGPVAMNVLDAQVQPLTEAGGIAPMLTHAQATDLGADASVLSLMSLQPTLSHTETVQRLRRRDTSHLLAVPLRGGGGQPIHGVVSVEIEASDHDAMALWARTAGAMQLAVDVTASALLAKPLRARPSPVCDTLMPVAGQRMRQLLGLLDVFARQPETLLLTGPTGTGKSRLAAWCHGRSAQSAGPFETVQLLTVPESMQMASLFGWKRGAFTGAIKDHAGSVTRAEGGTLFIDEIDKLSLKAQSGLLQLLETRTYQVHGELHTRTANLRFIVGTNIDLQRAVREGQFLEDLFYRINVLPVAIPALDERRDEIVGWACYMIERRHTESHAPGQAVLSGEAWPLLTAQSWPGNLRQLDNVARRAYALALANLGAVPDTLTVTSTHVQHALQFETDAVPDHRGPLEAMLVAAEAFVSVAQAVQDREGGLDLDHTDAFHGCVLHVARRQLKEVKAVYEMFGRDRVVSGRNHLREFRKAMKRLAALCEALGVTPDESLTESLTL